MAQAGLEPAMILSKRELASVLPVSDAKDASASVDRERGASSSALPESLPPLQLISKLPRLPLDHLWALPPLLVYLHVNLPLNDFTRPNESRTISGNENVYAHVTRARAIQWPYGPPPSRSPLRLYFPHPHVTSRCTVARLSRQVASPAIDA
jgi:hypothetical protein